MVKYSSENLPVDIPISTNMRIATLNLCRKCSISFFIHGKRRFDRRSSCLYIARSVDVTNETLDVKSFALNGVLVTSEITFKIPLYCV